jgi:hypothetical protein
MGLISAAPIVAQHPLASSLKAAAKVRIISETANNFGKIEIILSKCLFFDRECLFLQSDNKTTD